LLCRPSRSGFALTPNPRVRVWLPISRPHLLPARPLEPSIRSNQNWLRRGGLKRQDRKPNRFPAGLSCHWRRFDDSKALYSVRLLYTFPRNWFPVFLVLTGDILDNDESFGFGGWVCVLSPDCSAGRESNLNLDTGGLGVWSSTGSQSQGENECALRMHRAVPRILLFRI
ncbi:hypothetical protein P154DRAFT_589286, partial [Amniculicola lignicola CBS 123094]